MNRQRQIGQTGPQPISISDLWAYCDLMRLVPDDCEFLLIAIPTLDSIFLKDFFDQQEKRSRQASKAPTRKKL